MEGKLIPDYHYIEIKPDFSDLEERLAYYDAHPQEAQAIIDHAHEYVRPFRDDHREKLIALAVAQKYFRFTHTESTQSQDSSESGA
jgi:spore maturation protein CgeB